LRSPIARMSCRCTPFFFFGTEQFGGIHPHFFPFILQLSSGSSSSKTSFQNSFSDSVVDCPCYRLSPLLSFHMHAERKSWILTWKVWKFGRMLVPANPHCRHKAVTHRRSAVLARGKMKMLSPLYPTIQWPKASGDMSERDFAIKSRKKKKGPTRPLLRSVHYGKCVTWYSSQCMTEHKCLQQICKYIALLRHHVTKQATTKPNKACQEGRLEDKMNT
jgi:hypothetical protein